MEASENEVGSGSRRVRFVSMIADLGREPSSSATENDARETWIAATSPWDPALLELCDVLPLLEDAESPSPPEAGEFRIATSAAIERMPSGYRTQLEDAGAILLETGQDRDELIAKLKSRLEIASESPTTGEPGEGAIDRDFLALGAGRWWIGELTAAMNHADILDHEGLTRETLEAARAFQTGDRAGATNRLRAAFEILTQAKERFYPVDIYLIDFCLLDVSTRPETLDDVFSARSPVTFLATGEAIEALATRDPERSAKLRAAVSEGWADVVGGTWSEIDEPFQPLGSILRQFRRGGEAYRRHLDGRNVETLARRKYGLYPLLPQIAKRFGFRFALHASFDGGKFPIRPESKRLWESPDGSTLESLTRIPVTAESAIEGRKLPWRLAKTIRDDQTATLPLIHWASATAPWYADFRRMTSYSSVLARWTTFNDYFHLTDRPFESFRPSLDEYRSPYLEAAAWRGDLRPISGRVEHLAARARFDAQESLRAIASTLTDALPNFGEGALSPEQIEEKLELGDLDAARAELDKREPAWAATACRGITGTGTGGRPGYLVINPLGVARRVPVLLPDAAADLRPEGPLRAAQFTEEGVWAVVDLPAFGFAWVPRETAIDAAPAKLGELGVKGRVIRNDLLSVAIDEATGGVRALQGVNEPTARLGQQLIVNGLLGKDGKPVASKMRAAGFETDYGGPALVQARSWGTLLDPETNRAPASFEQRFRLWAGRPILEIDVTISDIDETLALDLAGGDPWTRNISCRWAWPDAESLLERTSFFASEITEAERPETVEAFNILTRRHKTTLLFGGLAHHRKHGSRMLDTILVAGKETERRFRLGVSLDMEHPHQAHLDRVSPVYVVPCETGPPRIGPTGWLFHIDNKGVAILGMTYREASADSRGWGVVLHLLETAGRSSRCRLRAFRDPSWARQLDFQDELIVDLNIEGDSAYVDLTPHELARVELTLG